MLTEVSNERKRMSEEIQDVNQKHTHIQDQAPATGAKNILIPFLRLYDKLEGELVMERLSVVGFELGQRLYFEIKPRIAIWAATIELETCDGERRSGGKHKHVPVDCLSALPPSQSQSASLRLHHSHAIVSIFTSAHRVHDIPILRSSVHAALR